MKQRKIFKKLVLSLAIFIVAVINYILKLYIPSILSSIICIIGVYTGFYSSGKMSIRWIRGWGTSLSGIC